MLEGNEDRRQFDPGVRAKRRRVLAKPGHYSLHPQDNSIAGVRRVEALMFEQECPDYAEIVQDLRDRSSAPYAPGSRQKRTRALLISAAGRGRNDEIPRSALIG